MKKHWNTTLIMLCVSGAWIGCASTQASRSREPSVPAERKIASDSGCMANAVTLRMPARVSDRPVVEGTVQPACAQVWVVVHPLSVSEFWVQAIPTVRADGAWILKPFIGREGEDYGEQFEVVAFANPKERLKEGLALNHWPAGDAKSDVTIVTKIAPSGGVIGGAAPVHSTPDHADVVSARPPESSQPASQPPSVSGNVGCKLLPGDSGIDRKYGSGWLDLSELTTIRAGSSLKLKIGGTAKNVLVRLLALL